VPDYKAPVDNALFLLNDVLGYPRYSNLSGFAEAPTETVAAVLREGARFAEEVLAPLNRIGDVEGCRRTEDGSFMVNEAFVWGGAEWTEGAVYSTARNATSIADHGLWQLAELHFGEQDYKGDTQWRSDLIVEGSDELRTAGFNPGLAYAQWNVTLTWFGERVPGGAHIRAGQLVEIDLSTFRAELSPITLPMRSVRVDFAGEVDPD